MKRNILRNTCAGLMVISVLAVPGALRAQQSATQQVDGILRSGQHITVSTPRPVKICYLRGNANGCSRSLHRNFWGRRKL